MRTTRQSLQAQLKILKKRLEHQIYQPKRKKSQKSTFSYLKVKRSQTFVWTEFAGSTQNIKKNCPNIKSTKNT
jgi:hypothetical protein